MKLVLFCLFSLPVVVFAQKFDNIWIIGDDNSLTDTTRGGMIIDFSYSPLLVQYHYREMNMFVCNASICDSSGNLLFYTNGCDIAGADDEILPGGEGLNPGYFHALFCDEQNRGYAGGYPNAVIIPKPDEDRTFYLFTKRSTVNGWPPTDSFHDKLLYSLIETDSFNSLVVTAKNVDVLQDTLSYGEMNAVKHANGIDWWIITPRRNSNQFYCLLLTAQGITDTILQTIGDMAPAAEEGSGQTTFSSDGTRMVRYYPYTPIMLYDFDRATGLFSNYSTFTVDYGDDLAWEGGCAISPNGRYLYISATAQVYQLDLQASDIGASKIKVEEWDGFLDPVAIVFGDCQLGPDCKIYIKSVDSRYYHVIHNPDEPGLACNVEQRGLVLPTPSGASLPYFPNYRLGPSDNPGVPCMPVVSVQEEPGAARPPGVRVYPNPASTQVTFSAEAAIRRIELTDIAGRVLREVSLSGTAQTYTLSLGELPAGMYLWRLEDAARRVRAGVLALR